MGADRWGEAAEFSSINSWGSTAARASWKEGPGALLKLSLQDRRRFRVKEEAKPGHKEERHCRFSPHEARSAKAAWFRGGTTAASRRPPCRKGSCAFSLSHLVQAVYLWQSVEPVMSWASCSPPGQPLCLSSLSGVTGDLTRATGLALGLQPGAVKAGIQAGLLKGGALAHGCFCPEGCLSVEGQQGGVTVDRSDEERPKSHLLKVGL